MDAIRFLDIGSDRDLALDGHYDLLLVLVSLAVASAAGFAALRVAERLAESESPRPRLAWLAVGAIALGVGVWAMHFVGMLAFRLPVEVHYDPLVTALSMIPSVAASGVALAMMSRSSNGRLRLHLGGLAMGAGIGAMHYTGMAAMMMNAEMRYDPLLFALSVVVAYALATAALYCDQHLAGARLRPAGALLMGCAVTGMHFTAMRAAYYFPSDVVCIVDEAALSSGMLAVAVTLAAILILGIAIVCALVDQRLRAISADLRASEERSRLIVETAGEGIVSIDERGTIDTFNRAAATMFGALPSQVIGRNVSLLMPEPDASAHDGHLARYAETGVSQLIDRRREVAALRFDGSSFPCMLTVTEVGRRGDRHHRFAAVLHDLTDQRQLEAQLLQAQKLESIGQLAAGIAHEINTPSQYVSDNLSFLDESFREVVPLLEKLDAEAVGATDLPFLQDEIPRALASARDGIARVTQIVSAMKEFSHPGSARKEPVDLNRAIQSTVIVASNEWKYVAEVELALDPALPPVPGIAAEINQVVLNVLVNAAQAIGATAAERGDAKGHIRIRTSVAGEHGCIEITDDGPGIPAAIQSRVFDPFFTTKDVGKGTGQGLAIARSIVVDKHGGRIELASEPGAGTTFRILLPIGEPARS
jgi:PAS domain S-box-containing protein